MKYSVRLIHSIRIECEQFYIFHGHVIHAAQVRATRRPTSKVSDIALSHYATLQYRYTNDVVWHTHMVHGIFVFVKLPND